MLYFGQVATGAYQLLGRPSQGDLPFQDVLDHAADVVNGLLIDMSLVARNHKTVASSWVTGTARTMSTALFGLITPDFIPVKVEWRALNGDTAARPFKLEVVAYEQLEAMTSRAENGETYCAFYNDTIVFSDLATTVTQKQYRIIYDPFILGTGTNVTVFGCSVDAINGTYTRRGVSNSHFIYNLVGQIDGANYAISWQPILSYWAVSDSGGSLIMHGGSSDEPDYPYDVETWTDVVTPTNTPFVVQGGGTPGAEGRTYLPDAFYALAKYETALRSVNRIRGLTTEEKQNERIALESFYAMERARFQRWNTTQYGDKLTKKLGFRPRSRNAIY